jgi:hypothetical protein
MGVEQAMNWLIELYWSVLLKFCIAGLIISLLGLLAITVFAPAWERLREWFSLPAIQRFVVGIFAVGLIHYGATKGNLSVTYDGGIRKSAQSNTFDTNDVVTIVWERDYQSGIIVPMGTPVYIDIRPLNDTTAEWMNVGEALLEDYQWSGVVPNATNYAFNVWAYYIPPEPVHTNGVWVYKTMLDRRAEKPLPLRARVEINGKAIATPKEARKDEENDD